MEEGHLVIWEANHPRAGWDESFRTMAQNGDDALLDGYSLLLTRWDEEEWDWP